MKAISTIMISLVAIITTGTILARELYPGQYAQVPPEVRQWFNNQKVPSGPRQGMSCCSISDGAYAEEDIRQGEDGNPHYWASWCLTKDKNGNCEHYSGWQEIPDEIVIHDPNKNGGAVVWFSMAWSNGIPKVANIYCYSPGAGM